MGLVASSSALLLLLSLVSFCVSEDEISPAKPLIFPDGKLISDNGFFALGLFSPTNSSSLFYMGIWYNTDPQRTVVWVANRDNPIMDPQSSTLAVTNRSELVLSDGKGRIYWSTTEDGNGTAPSSTGGAGATLLKQGNLVLRSSNGSILWQSYDHPTDTILANMPFRMSYRRPSTGQRLVSWKGPDDPSPGDFSFAGDGIQFLIWHGSNVIWRSPPLNSRMVTSYQPSYPSPAIITALAITGDVVSVTYSTSDGSLGMHARVAPDSGNFEFRIWNNATSSWTAMEAVIPGLGCNQYGSCGPFGYCDVSAAVPTCRCPDGFEPSNGTRPSAGCARKERLRCGGRDRFATLPYMKMPATPVFVRNRTFDACAAECLGNCSCTAYAHANLTGAISGGDSSRCLMWFGDLVDMAGYGQLTGEDLFLRLATSSSSVPKKSSLLKILLPITSGVLLAALLVALVWTCKYIGIQQKKKTQKRMMLEYLRTSDDDSGIKNIEFPFISFEDIVAATNNFSNSNMLGRGGFGKVYKGILGGTKEVAIKRLSKGSGQGIEEFKNEVVLISKLQHKNLAKLLGCCIQEDEKMLVYEYLPNKSLDYFLFDSARKSVLQWTTRFKIIQGIARGIMYLHHDSRLTIIHRDLKASNILLDKDMSPKISDFGMARIFRGDQLEANTKRVVGTYGYMPHEYAMEGAFSVKSDTYSFGVLLLEIVSGLKISSPQLMMDFPNLIVYAWNMWKDGKIEDFIDSSLMNNCPLDEVSRCIHIGLLCLQDSPDYRPLMSAVVFMLENKTTLLPVPSQPVYFARKNAEPERGSNNRISTVSMNDLSLTTLAGR